LNRERARWQPVATGKTDAACAEAAKHKHMVQRVGYFIVFIVFLTACRLRFGSKTDIRAAKVMSALPQKADIHLRVTT